MEPKDKRRPTLADRFISTRVPRDYVLLPSAYERVQRGVRNARRFVLDEEACVRIAEIVMKVPDLLVREMQFARAPFDLTWIEWPSWHYWITMKHANPESRAAHDRHGEWASEENADYETGYLIEHNRVNCIAGGPYNDRNRPPIVTLMQYHLHTEWPFDERKEFLRRSGLNNQAQRKVLEDNRPARDATSPELPLEDIIVDACLWGSSISDVTMERRRVLREQNVCEYLPLNPKHPRYREHMGTGGMFEQVRGSVGDLRTVVCLLLMLNRPSIAQYKHTLPNSKGFVRGKLTPFLTHTTVSISLDAAETLRLIGTPAGEGVARRRHEVRGHYCHDKTARDFMRIAGCLHEWVPTHKDWTPWPDAGLDEPDNWLCSVCEGKRWWRNEHERGTAQQGFVAHDGYEVSP